MTSHYTNIISTACLFLSLFIAPASARSSLIRQFTDDFNTSLQSSEENGARTNLEEAKFISHSHQEISSRDYNSNPVTWNIDNFSTRDKQSYDSPKFSREGVLWYLQVWPNGYGSFSPNLAVHLFQDDKLFRKLYVDVWIILCNRYSPLDVKRRFGVIYEKPKKGYGANMVSQADLRDISKGFLVNDVLTIKLDFVEVREIK